MSLHANHARNDNQPLQPMSIPHVRLERDLVRRYRCPLSADPRRMITGRADARSLATSSGVFSDEIRAKYTLEEMQKPRAFTMIYRMLSSALSAFYQHIHMTVPLSFNIRPMGTLLSPFFRISRQTSMSFLMMVKGRTPAMPITFERRADRATRAAGSGAASLNRFKIPGHLPGVFLAPRHRSTDGTSAGITHLHLGIPNELAGRVLSANRGQGLSQPTTVLAPMLGSQPLAPMPSIQPPEGQASTAGAQGLAPQPVAPDLSRQRTLLHRFHVSSIPGQRLGYHTLSRAENQQTEQPLPVIRWQQSIAYDPRPTPRVTFTPIASSRAAIPWLGAWSIPHLAANLTGKTDPIVTTKITEDLHRMTVIRREAPFEPPRLSYPLVQPPVAQKAQVATAVREQEVVNVVRNEIQSYMAAGSPLKQFSRSDFAHIADHVYSSLTRRLLVEKERLGLR